MTSIWKQRETLLQSAEMFLKATMHPIARRWCHSWIKVLSLSWDVEIAIFKDTVFNWFSGKQSWDQVWLQRTGSEAKKECHSKNVLVSSRWLTTLVGHLRNNMRYISEACGNYCQPKAPCMDCEAMDCTSENTVHITASTQEPPSRRAGSLLLLEQVWVGAMECSPGGWSGPMQSQSLGICWREIW